MEVVTTEEYNRMEEENKIAESILEHERHLTSDEQIVLLEGIQDNTLKNMIYLKEKIKEAFNDMQHGIIKMISLSNSIYNYLFLEVNGDKIETKEEIIQVIENNIKNNNKFINDINCILSCKIEDLFGISIPPNKKLQEIDIDTSSTMKQFCIDVNGIDFYNNYMKLIKTLTDITNELQNQRNTM